MLTGVQGKDPGYDPLAFMVEAAHSRGMAIHAWLNPYRVTTTGTDLTALSSNHPARLNPSWTFTYNNALYYNPEVEGVKQHIVDTVTEIAKNYSVDGIHFDDYFYPSSYPLTAGEDKDGLVANMRRHHVNYMVSRVHTAVKSVNNAYGKNIIFGISPAGIWKNNTTDSTGSATNGNQSYYSVYADTRSWIQNGWIDYVVPQIYWETGHKLADYETLVKWWSNEVNGTNVKLYVGQGVYRDAVAKQIAQQLNINAKYSNVSGSFYFSLRDLLNNRMNAATQIATYYEAKNLIANGGLVSNNTTTNNSSTNDTTSATTPSINTNTGTNMSDSTTNHAVTITSPAKGVVTATTLNIRSGARVDRDIITKVAKDTTLTVRSELNGWYKIQLADGTIGFASAQYIRVNPTQKAIVTATTLNLRSDSNAASQIIAVLNQDDAVEVYSKQGDWYNVKTQNGTIGWVNANYIKLN